MSIKGQGHFFTIYFQVLYVLRFTGPRYQVSVYRTIGPLVLDHFHYKRQKIYVASDINPKAFTHMGTQRLTAIIDASWIANAYTIM